MEQFRAFHVLELLEYAHDVLHVVTIEGTEVAHVHALKDVLLMADSRLDGIVQPDDAFPAVVVEQSFGM